MKNDTAMLFALAVLSPVFAIDNGLGIVPPRGWRSWNAYTCTDSSNSTLTGGNILTADVMRDAMHAVLDDSRTVNGTKTTLASLGFDYVSMDGTVCNFYLGSVIPILKSAYALYYVCSWTWQHAHLSPTLRSVAPSSFPPRASLTLRSVAPPHYSFPPRSCYRRVAAVQLFHKTGGRSCATSLLDWRLPDRPLLVA